MYEEKSFPLQEKKKKCLGKEFLLAQIHFSRLYFIHKRVHTNSEAMIYCITTIFFIFSRSSSRGRPHIDFHCCTILQYEV